MKLDLFHPAVARWFARSFPAPTDPQLQSWPEIKKHRHTLIAAPTGSGKTLAAFLSAIDDLVRLGVEGKLDDTTHVIYVSPLKALSNDVQRNLQVPLEGIQEELNELGLPEVNIRTLVRTGDTPASERTAMTKRPPHIVFPGNDTPNYLRFRLGPSRVAIALGAVAKRPGAEMRGREVELLVCDTGHEEVGAYERLIGAALVGDRSLFAREDGVLEAWRIVDPLLRPRSREAPELYEPGSRGPAAADTLVAASGGWRPIHDALGDCP